MTMLNFSFLLLCLIVRTNIATNAEIQTNVSEILHNVCPGATVCLGNQTHIASDEDHTSVFTSCCDVLECSCDEDCYKTGNCCFPFSHRSNPDYDINKNVKEYDQTCLFLSTVPPQSNTSIYFQKYKMITSVKMLTDSADIDLSAAQCGNQTVAPWGSLYPVFSKSKNRLYKNIACANSDGSLDVIVFVVFLVCDKYDPSNTYFSNLQKHLWNVVHTKNGCRIEFKYPGDTRDLKWHSCFDEPINSCQASFTIRASYYLNHTHEKSIKECEGRLDSRISEKEIYANFFCHACVEGYARKDLTCEFGDISRGPSSGYTILIDTNFIFNFNNNDIVKRIARTSCRAVFNDKCRPVTCPSGQMYDHLGRCTYINKMWFGQKYQIIINLTSTSQISQIERQLIQDNLLQIKYAMNSPWPKQWFFKEIFAPLTASVQETVNFLVILQYEILNVRPHVLMKMIKKTINMDWTLEIANKSFYFKSDLNPFYLVNYEETNEHFVNETEKIFASRYIVAYSRVHLRKRFTLLVTKLFLCNQIELTPQEFRLNSMKDVLYNNISKDYLFENEFLLYTSSNGREHAKVCIEDSGFVELSNQILNSSCYLYGGKFEALTVCLLGLYYFH